MRWPESAGRLITLAARGWPVRAPHRTFATVDHILPTSVDGRRLVADPMAGNHDGGPPNAAARAHGIPPLFDPSTGAQGIVRT